MAKKKNMNEIKGFAVPAKAREKPDTLTCSILLPCTPRLCVPGRVRPGHPQTPGGQSAGDPQAKVVGGREVSQGGRPPCQRYSAPWWHIASGAHCHLLMVRSLSKRPTPVPPHRTGHGEHRGDLCGAGLWPAGGHLHSSAGVRLDASPLTRDRGERCLCHLHLLCVPLPALMPPSPPPHPQKRPAEPQTRTKNLLY